jgi:hypothetical protein
MSGHKELWTLPELSVSPPPSSAQPAEHIQNVAIKYFMLNYLYNMEMHAICEYATEFRSWFTNGSS